MDATLIDIVVKVFIGGAIGFFIGLTGVGGGVIVVPTLTLLFGLPPTIAVGTASLYAFISQFCAAVKHYKLRNINFGIIPLFLLGALPVNLAVSFSMNIFLRNNYENQELIARFQTGLKYFIAAVVIGSASLLLMRWKNSRKLSGADAGKCVAIIRSSRKIFFIVGVAAGAFVGGLIGATSVGGGIIIAPVLMVVFGFSAGMTVGTSVSISSVLTLVTATIFLAGGQLDVSTSLLMAAGSVFGTRAGANFADRVKQSSLQMVMIIVIFLSGLLMLFH